PQDEEFMSLLTSTLTSTRASSSPTPLPLLRPLLFRLQDRALLARVRERVLGVLAEGLEEEDEGPTLSSSATSTPQPHSQSPDQSHKQNPARPENSPALPTNPTPSLRAHFRESLARALFGADELLRLRLKLAVADFMRKNLSISTTSDPTAIPLSDPSVLSHAEATHLASTILAAIAHRVQGIIIQHVVAVVRFLGAPDLPFALRLALQATLPGSPPSLVSRGRELLHALRGRELLSDADLASLEGLERTHGSQEGDVMQVDAGSAYRLDFLPRAARCWVVDELLQSVGRCIVCGGGFVSVL
ncbi:hypothetical protein GGG16DRAFT_60475, partial [Schizophyllum commune]